MTDPRPCREQERQSREMSIAAITIWLLLFFGAVSLTTSYVALRTGVLIDGAAIQAAGSAAATQ